MTYALIAYLVVLVAIAVRSAWRVKDIPDFFVARKAASAKAVAGSLVATILGGSAVIGAVDSGAKLGGAASWFMLVGALGLLALIPFAGRAYSHGKYALPDLVENLYGKGPRVVASVVIPVAWTGIVAAQIIAAAKLLMTFTALDYTTAAIISAAVFTGYTLAGGQLSILRTDFMQACLIIVGLLLLAGFALFGVEEVHVGQHRTAHGHHAVHRAHEILGEELVARTFLVGDEVVEDRDAADAFAACHTVHRAQRRRHERQPELGNQQIGLLLLDVTPYGNPVEGVDGVETPCNLQPFGGRLGAVLRLAGEEERGILQREGDNLHLMPLRLVFARQPLVEGRQAAAIGPRCTQDDDFHRLLEFEHDG